MSNPSFDHNFSYISSHPADYSHSSWQPLVKTPGPSRLATLCRFFSCTRARLWPSSQKGSTRTNSFFCAELTDWSEGRTGAWVVSCAPNGRCASSLAGTCAWAATLPSFEGCSVWVPSSCVLLVRAPRFFFKACLFSTDIHCALCSGTGTWGLCLDWIRVRHSFFGRYGPLGLPDRFKAAALLILHN